MDEAGSFKTQQLEYSRVRQAYADHLEGLKTLLADKGIASFDLELCLLAFKEEGQLEAWVKPAGEPEFMKLISFPICSSSGTAGPKRRQGDEQVPEGFYHIDRFNPSSSFWLSLGINYPNTSDLVRKTGSDAGGDIFIHGDCVTIGCIPITDRQIGKLYVLAVEARDHGQQRIPVCIFPFRMDEKRWTKVGQDDSNYSFWQELRPGYLHFKEKKTEIRFRVDATGRYILN